MAASRRGPAHGSAQQFNPHIAGRYRGGPPVEVGGRVKAVEAVRRGCAVTGNPEARVARQEQV